MGVNGTNLFSVPLQAGGQVNPQSALALPGASEFVPSILLGLPNKNDLQNLSFNINSLIGTVLSGTPQPEQFTIAQPPIQITNPVQLANPGTLALTPPPVNAPQQQLPSLVSNQPIRGLTLQTGSSQALVNQLFAQIFPGRVAQQQGVAPVVTPPAEAKPAETPAAAAADPMAALLLANQGGEANALVNVNGMMINVNTLLGHEGGGGGGGEGGIGGVGSDGGAAGSDAAGAAGADGTGGADASGSSSGAADGAGSAGADGSGAAGADGASGSGSGSDGAGSGDGGSGAGGADGAGGGDGGAGGAGGAGDGGGAGGAGGAGDGGGSGGDGGGSGGGDGGSGGGDGGGDGGGGGSGE